MASTEDLVIEGSKRQSVGKRATRQLRREGHLPAVLNHRGESTPLSLNPKLLSKAWANERQFTLDLEGNKKTVKITDLQLDAVKRLPVHVDLEPIG